MTELLQKQLNELQVKVATVKGEIMEAVRKDFASKESLESLTKDCDTLAALVRQIDKRIYAAIVVIGLVVLFGRLALRYLS